MSVDKFPGRVSVDRFSAVSVVALVLASGVAFAIVALSIGAAVTEAGVGTGNLSTESSTLLSTSLGAAIGAIATYLGGRIAAGAAGAVLAVNPPPAPQDPSATSEFPTVEIPPE